MNEKILIVDDNDTNRSMAIDVLSQWGYQTTEAKHGGEVFDIVKDAEPDLILLDVMLPGMNGYEICQQLKRDPQTQHIPVIMLTVLDDSESRTRGISVGADLFVSRPPNYNELHRNIESLLKNSLLRRDTESIDSLFRFLDRLLKSLSEEAHQRHTTALSYAIRTAKEFRISEDSVRRMAIGSALLHLESLTPANKGGIEEIIAPLNIASWANEFLAYQKRPSATGPATDIAVIYHLCLRYCQLSKETSSPESALAEIQRNVGESPKRASVVNALRQVIEDELFLTNIRAQTENI